MLARIKFYLGDYDVFHLVAKAEAEHLCQCPGGPELLLMVIGAIKECYWVGCSEGTYPHAVLGATVLMPTSTS